MQISLDDRGGQKFWRRVKDLKGGKFTKNFLRVQKKEIHPTGWRLQKHVPAKQACSGGGGIPETRRGNLPRILAPNVVKTGRTGGKPSRGGFLPNIHLAVSRALNKPPSCTGGRCFLEKGGTTFLGPIEDISFGHRIRNLLKEVYGYSTGRKCWREERKRRRQKAS